MIESPAFTHGDLPLGWSTFTEPLLETDPRVLLEGRKELVDSPEINVAPLSTAGGSGFRQKIPDVK